MENYNTFLTFHQKATFMSITNKPARGYRTLRLPISEEEYSGFVEDRIFAKETLDNLYQQHPELFPVTFDKGYVFNGFTKVSVKQGCCLRRIRLKADEITFTVAPVFVMPYMTAMTVDVEKGLFLRRFNVPFWGLAYVFGRNAMYWYRQEQSLSRLSIVGTTIKDPEKLPEDLLADEKHTRRKGEKQYIAMTVAKECILGAELTEFASEKDLTEAYGVFAQEAQEVKPDYSPDTVNTDGWEATQNAWSNIFPGITVILCFLHAFIGIRNRAIKALREPFIEASSRLWEAYRATSRASFSQQLRRLKEWAEREVPESPMKEKILALCAKRKRFVESYAHGQAYRTSNMVDRLMKFFDRACFDAMYFHGTLASGRQRVRAWAILWNFCPSSPITVKKYNGQLSPAERLNNKRYADLWLMNLLISGSMNGTSGYQQNPL